MFKVVGGDPYLLIRHHLNINFISMRALLLVASVRGYL
jgi:hypothetical protein